MNTTSSRTTVSISIDTKSKMDKWRAPGQCYDGFLCQLVDLWERMHPGNSNFGKLPGRNKPRTDS